MATHGGNSMEEVAKCPVCRTAVTGEPINTWNFRSYLVKRYQCQQCESKFNVYKGSESTFTIPKPKLKK